MYLLLIKDKLGHGHEYDPLDRQEGWLLVTLTCLYPCMNISGRINISAKLCISMRMNLYLHTKIKFWR